MANLGCQEKYPQQKLKSQMSKVKTFYFCIAILAFKPFSSLFVIAWQLSEF